MFGNIPVWLYFWVADALMGEIYPSIRAIAVGWYEEQRELTLRYYFDREPDEDDYENISVVMTNIFSNTSSNNDIRKANEEIIYTEDLFKDLDSLSSFVYMRMEVFD